MSKNVKFNVRAKRYTVLIDIEIYNRAKELAIGKKMKWYQYLNKLLADATGKPFPTYLKHITLKDED